jgi:hypothetical protein
VESFGPMRSVQDLSPRHTISKPYSGSSNSTVAVASSQDRKSCAPNPAWHEPLPPLLWVVLTLIHRRPAFVSKDSRTM